MVSIASSEIESEVEWPAPPSRAVLAWRDLADGFGKIWMWWTLALQDIRPRYPGSVLGPFWLTISTLMMAVAMGLLYSQLFRMEVSTYLPFLTLGLAWQWLSSTIAEGCDIFAREASVMTVAGSGIAFAAFARFRSRIAYWI